MIFYDVQHLIHILFLMHIAWFSLIDSESVLLPLYNAGFIFDVIRLVFCLFVFIKKSDLICICDMYTWYVSVFFHRLYYRLPPSQMFYL